jgi:hypothetical protein
MFLITKHWFLREPVLKQVRLICLKLSVLPGCHWRQILIQTLRREEPGRTEKDIGKESRTIRPLQSIVSVELYC